jgi:hypothetical protein
LLGSVLSGYFLFFYHRLFGNPYATPFSKRAPAEQPKDRNQNRNSAAEARNRPAKQRGRKAETTGICSTRFKDWKLWTGDSRRGRAPTRYQSLLVGGYEKPPTATLEGRHMSRRTMPGSAELRKIEEVNS